jgi:uncharacterized protein DUF6882
MTFSPKWIFTEADVQEAPVRYGRAVVTFTELQDDAALISLEAQLHMSDQVGLAAWKMDLEQPYFDLIADERTVRCTDVHLLGSAAPGPQSWLWAWANPGDYRAEIMAIAHEVRGFGERNAIPELTTAEVPFAALPGSPTDPVAVGSFMMEAAKAITGRYSAYLAPVGGGTRFGFLLEHPEFELPGPEGPRVMRVLNQGLMELGFHNQRHGVESYARRREGLEVATNGPVTRITGPGFTIDIRFDERGLFTAMSAQLGDKRVPPEMFTVPDRSTPTE